MIATRSDSLGGSSATYSKCAILEAPPFLPDGYYEASFCGQSAFLHRLNGSWSLGVPWPQTPVRHDIHAEASAMMMHPAAYAPLAVSK